MTGLHQQFRRWQGVVPVCLAALAAASCVRGVKQEIAPPAKPTAVILSRSLDDVTASLTTFFAGREMPIHVVGRPDRVLVTTSLELSEKERARWIVCASNLEAADATSIGVGVRAWATIAVSARAIGDSSAVIVSMQVTATREVHPLTCHSTGELESRLMMAMDEPPSPAAARDGGLPARWHGILIANTTSTLALRDQTGGWTLK